MAKVHDLWMFVRTVYPHDTLLQKRVGEAVVEAHSLIDPPGADGWRGLYQAASIRASMAKMDGDKAAELAAENEAECFAYFYKRAKKREEA